MKSTHVNPPIAQNRKRLDEAYFKEYGVWRHKYQRRKIFKGVKISIADETLLFYQFRYLSFPKDILFELGKHTRVGWKVSTKSTRQWLFINAKQLSRIDPMFCELIATKTMSKTQWERFKLEYGWEKINLVEKEST